MPNLSDLTAANQLMVWTCPCGRQINAHPGACISKWGDIDIAAVKAVCRECGSRDIAVTIVSKDEVRRANEELIGAIFHANRAAAKREKKGR